MTSGDAARPATADEVRAEVRAWIAAHWDPERSLVDWRRDLVTSGWAVPHWAPSAHGLGLPAWSEHVVSDELRRAGAVGLPPGAGTGLAAPTLMEHGSDDLRARFLAPILTGEETWCQLFSEPGAGSDLAGLTTRADRDGDHWVISGQKVWNTSAHHADFGLLVARTDWDAPKHRGLTYFVLPMAQPGIEVRPLRQMNHHASFNEVFMTEAIVPHDLVVGTVGEGWRVALTTLAYERRFGVMGAGSFERTGGRALREAAEESARHVATYAWYPQRAGRVDLLVPHAQAAGRAGDAVVRQEIASTVAAQRIGTWTARRAQAARALGRAPGAEGSIGKLALSEVARGAARAHSSIVGADGMLEGPTSPFDGMIAEVLLSVPAQSIAGGTDEIQHNILGEQALGLPREPAVDRDLPFRQVPRNG